MMIDLFGNASPDGVCANAGTADDTNRTTVGSTAAVRSEGSLIAGLICLDYADGSVDTGCHSCACNTPKNDAFCPGKILYEWTVATAVKPRNGSVARPSFCKCPLLAGPFRCLFLLRHGFC